MARRITRGIMLILAIDSSSTACSTALARDGIPVARRGATMARGHGAALPPMIAEILEHADVAAADLGAIAVTTGPGSFTGLRIGMAAAKGLALALDRPLVGISCFDAIAGRAAADATTAPWDLLVIALESKREELYLRCLRPDGGAVIAGAALTASALANRVAPLMAPGSSLHVIGDAAQRVADEVRQTERPANIGVSVGSTEPPDAADVAQLADQAMRRDGRASTGYIPGLAPLYLRPPDIVAPKP
jgi:tRNA threonylcarbamoyladenosine biosynthesis protein TsaB